MTGSKPSSALERLKVALLKEAEALERGRRTFPTSVSNPGASATIDGWRTILYLQLMASRPEFDPREAAQLAVMLSRDAAFTSFAPNDLANAACRLLGRSPQLAGPET